ncbi:MAG: tetratricopeptide repeat protein, partial [Gammaproteobacteria bacterium]|nr:tetratricopeptide repeat protein [Gammaproteobacteria bacterium]
MTNSDQKNPSNAEIDTLFAAYDAGNFQRSESICRQLLERYPESGFVLNMLGATQDASGRSTEALQSYEKAIEVEPGYADTYNNIGILLKRLGKHEEALARFQKAVEIDPDYGDACNNLGVMLQESGEHDAAAPHFATAIKLNPNTPFFHFNYANSQRAQGKLKEALNSFDKAIGLRRGFSEAYNNRGNLLEDMLQYEEARKSYS